MEGDVTDKDFIAEGGIEVTDKMLEDWAEPWERGEVSGTAAGFVSSPGPPMHQGGLLSIHMSGRCRWTYESVVSGKERFGRCGE